jgi:transitional endoplasmic reticulum ATPase
MQGLVCKSSYSFNNYGEGNFIVASFADYKTLVEDDQIYFINLIGEGPSRTLFLLSSDETLETYSFKVHTTENKKKEAIPLYFSGSTIRFFNLEEGQKIQFELAPLHFLKSWDVLYLYLVDDNPAKEFSYPSTLYCVKQLEDLAISNESVVQLRHRDGFDRKYKCYCSRGSGGHIYNDDHSEHVEELKWESYGLVTENTRIIIKPNGAPLPSQQPHKISLAKFNTYDRNTVESLALSMAFNLTLNIPHWEMKPAQKILIHGPSGVGKSTLVKKISVDAGVEVIAVDSVSLLQLYTEQSSVGAMKIMFERAIKRQPAILLFDDIDVLLMEDEKFSTLDSAKQFLTQFVHEMQGINFKVQVLVIGVTSRIESLDITVRKCFESELALSVPTESQRKEILLQNFDGLSIKRSPHATLDEKEAILSSLSRSLFGYSGSDLVTLVSFAKRVALERFITGHYENSQDGEVNILVDDIELAKRSVKPQSVQQVSPQITDVTWDDIGGLEDIKKQLQQMTVWIYQHAESFKQLGIDPVRGILLYGPPGTGKTMLAKCVASQSATNFISVNISEIVKSEVGESEKTIAEIFRVAKRASPSVVFFDEIEALFSNRDSAGTFGKNLIAQLSLELDNLHADKDSSVPSVIVIAATNFPEYIDKSFLRPGRFERLVYVPPPDNEARKAIFLAHFKMMKVADDVRSEMFIEKLVNESQNCTGADIDSICMKAGLEAIQSDTDCQAIPSASFEKVLSSFIPSITSQSIQRYKNLFSTNFSASLSQKN